jgi:HTH-type transcriptional regulator / antitoxin HipB
MRSDGSDDTAWPQALAIAVRTRRKHLGLTQRELSALAGCGPVFIYDLETGKASLRLDKVLDVLHVLGLQLALEPGTQRFRVSRELAS